MSNRSPFPLPVTLGEIDRDWLTAALRTRAPGVTVRGVEIVDVNRGTCTKIRLRLDLDEAGKQAAIPETVILKGGFEPHSRGMDFMHEREVRGYRDVLPVLKLHSPVCYFAEFDAERRQGIVIMEDLVARGISFCHPLKPQAHDDVARRLTALAQFHAQTWDSPDLQPGGRWNWIDDMMHFFRGYMTPFLEPGAWADLIGSTRGAAASVRFHDRDWVAHGLNRLATLSARLPHAVLHGDAHLGNLYVEADGTPGFFDSLPRHGPGILEVAYHVGGALDPADRPRREGALVRHYLDELGRNGIVPPDFDATMRHYGAFLLFGYCMFLINDSAFQSDAINTAYTARFGAAMLHHRTEQLLAAIG